MKRVLSIQELTALLENLLAGPPSKAGKRLCSERELSVKIKVDRMKVQKAFDALVEKGILVRRHGSGTYVRKVPKKANLNGGGESSSPPLLPPDELFAVASSKSPVRRQVNEAHRRLNLAIIPNRQWRSESNHSIFAGIKDRIHQAGHQFRIISVTGPDEEALLAEKLRQTPGDGYILWVPYEPLLHKVFGTQLPPAVFIGARERMADLQCSPVVRIDMEDAIVRALRLLAEEGYQRIGFIGLQSQEREYRLDEGIYSDTLNQLGLCYRSICFCPLDKEKIEEQMHTMFAGKAPPEALYVADDIVLRYLVPIWKKMKLVPGGNLGVITLSSRRVRLPAGYQWSRMEFNPFQVGRMAVDALLQEIETAGEEICSFEHLAAWHPGETHRRDAS